MSVVIFYSASEGRDCKKDLPKLSATSFELSWLDPRKAASIDPLSPTILACGLKNKLSFVHLNGPFIFVEDSVVVTEDLIDKVSQLSGNCVMVGPDSAEATSATFSGSSCYGISLDDTPQNLDTTTYQSFRSWIGENAEMIGKNIGQKSRLEVRLAG